MTPATSVSFYKPVFGDFLYAPVDAGWNGNPLSVLSALARLNVDPWMEAAELAGLPRDSALRRLAELLQRLPSRPWARTEPGPIADRLLKLLPHVSSSGVPATPTGRSTPQGQVTFSPRLRMIMFAIAIGVYAIAVGAHRMSLTQSDMPVATIATASQSPISQPSP